MSFRLGAAQHSIRRYEFDDWLLQRSGADFAVHTVRRIEEHRDGYLLDGAFRCKYLVGAGGSSCPVYRSLFRQLGPRPRALQVATLEQEFPFPYRDEACHLWFFRGGLPGYAWYVPKESAYLNVGLGAMSAQLNSGTNGIHQYWTSLVRDLAGSGLVTGHTWEPKGHSYYLRGVVSPMRMGNAFVIGDAAGLATRDLCEGIGPAVRSALAAAEAITGRRVEMSEAVPRFSLRNRLLRKSLQYMLVGRSH
jgi:flavin-dependent dehydrogenase